MLVVPSEIDIYDWLEGQIANGGGIPHAVEHNNCIYLVRSIFPEKSEGSLLEDIGFKLSADRKRWERCSSCRGVGRIDCCDAADCKKCGGLFTAWCADCEAGRMQIRMDEAERKFHASSL